MIRFLCLFFIGVCFLTSCESDDLAQTSITLETIVHEYDLAKNSLLDDSHAIQFAQEELDSIYIQFSKIESIRGQQMVMTGDQFEVTLASNKAKPVNLIKSNDCYDPYIVLTPASCVAGGHISATHPAGYGAPYGFAIDFDYNDVPNGTMNHGWNASNINSHLYGFSGPINWHQTSTRSRWGARGLVVDVYGYISVSGSGGYATGTYHLELVFDPISNNWYITVD